MSIAAGPRPSTGQCAKYWDRLPWGWMIVCAWSETIFLGDRGDYDRMDRFRTENEW